MDDPLLSTTEIAARLGVQPVTWRALVSRGEAPAPDVPELDRPPGVRWPRWRLSTVEAWRKTRPGQGRRTDLIKKEGT